MIRTCTIWCFILKITSNVNVSQNVCVIIIGCDVVDDDSSIMFETIKCLSIKVG